MFHLPESTLSPWTPPPLFLIRRRERDLQDPERTKYTNNKLTQEEISMITPAATNNPVLRILSACGQRSQEVEGREGASTGPHTGLHHCL